MQRSGPGRRVWITCLCIILLALFRPHALHAEEGTASSLSSSATQTVAVAGRLSTRYVYRSADLPDGRVSDQDVFGDLACDLTRPLDNRYEFHLLGTARSDLDGNRTVQGYSPFTDIGNTYGRRTSGQLIEAAAVLNDPLAYLKRITIGRQIGTRVEQLFFDGMAAEIGGRSLLVTLYGGAAVHFYEVGAHWGRDTLQGAGIDYRPVPSLGVSADALVVRDLREFDPAGATRRDRLLSFKVTQRFEPYTRVTVRYRYLDGEPRDLSVTAAGAWEEQDAEASLSYLRQFKPQAERSDELSPFYDVIGVSAPFQSVGVKARKSFANRVAFDVGYFRRDLLDRADEGPFNKEFTRGYVDAEVSDFLFAHLAWTVTAEQWKTGTTRVHAAGTDLSYRTGKGGKMSRVNIGTFYSLFKYDDFVQLGLRERVRTYYLEARYPVAAAVSVHGRYEYERAIDRYQTVKAGVRYDF